MIELCSVKCPACGTENKNLVLEETDGWMECEHCRLLVKALPYEAWRKVPIYTPEQLTQMVVKAI